MAQVHFHLEIGGYNEALTEYMRRATRGSEEILQQQAKLIADKAIKLTPPGKENVYGKEAERLGNKTVETNIRRLFSPQLKTGKRKQEKADIEAATAAMHKIHQQHRDRRGRVKRSLGKSKYKVWKKPLTDYIKATKERVGKLAHGWASAADKLGVKLPAWISRHAGSASGSIKIEANDREIFVTMENNVQYASEMKGIQNRLNRAVRMQESALIRQLNDLLGDDSPFRRV